MNFELGKTYIVDVTEKGIIPQEVFDRDRWYDKDSDELDFLTDEEKIVVINNVLDKIRTEIEQDAFKDVNGSKYIFVNRINHIIDKYKAKNEG